ncbi:hypothetical protein [uncultured Desulfovibrio sp.]|uniref:hypothetical protein n=1 Tax=uncultured Desulfovibrio sp. TaxID=167968 RepID=UPI00272C83B5|nr:hypothetical protein [uncultured Desulfovibrio sp.]
MELDETMLEEMRKTILPEIKAAAEDALRAHSAAERPGGENFSDNWVLGCACWRILFNRLNTRLEKHSFFKKKVSRNVMEISCPNGDELFAFYVYRVNDDLRIPRGAKSIKVYLEQQLWLSDEIKSSALAQSSGVNIIGYDISIESGLGNITLDRLCASGKNKFESVPLYDFSTPEQMPDSMTKQSEKIAASIVSSTPEEISKPAVNMDNAEEHAKKFNG